MIRFFVGIALLAIFIIAVVTGCATQLRVGYGPAAGAPHGIAFEMLHGALDKTPQSVTWEYGDGSDQEVIFNPTHVYKAAGTYNVTATAMFEDGTKVIVPLQVKVQ